MHVLRGGPWRDSAYSGKNPLLSDQIASNYRKADITPRQKLMLDFAVKVSQRAYEIEESDLQMLHQQGFTDDDIWDIAAISAFSGYPTAWPISVACGRTKSFI